MKPNYLYPQGGGRPRSALGRLLGLTVLLLAAAELPAAQISGVMGSGGGAATSASYGLTDTVGQLAVGAASSASYTLSDGFWNDVNSPPVAGVVPTLSVTNLAGAISVATLLGAVTDPDGDPLTLYSLDALSAMGGSLTLSNGWVYYEAPPGFTGLDSFQYTVTDADGNLITSLANILNYNSGPTLEPIPDQIAYVLLSLILTNNATDPDLPLTFTLAAGSPAGAFVDPTNGIFWWAPERDQARSTNVISIIVTDAGLPPASATNTFTVVVGDYVEIGFGRMAAGTAQTNSVAISFDTSASLTNLQVIFQAPEDVAIAVALSDWAPEVGAATLLHLGLDTWQIEFTAGAGQVLAPTPELARLSFWGVANPSAFAPITFVSLTNRDTEGGTVWRTLGHDGLVAVVAVAPLMEALARTNELPNLVLYGNPGVGYEVQMTTVLPATSWQSVWQGTVPDEHALALTSITNVSPTMFFRARSIALP